MFNIPFLDLPPLQDVRGHIRLPGSKSISNRALLLAALCPETTRIEGLLHADDTRYMLQALAQLGCSIKPQEEGILEITGLDTQRMPAHSQLFLGNAGTVMRPLTAALALLGGTHELDGVARMRERPIGDLVDALRALGCRIDYLGQSGYPPLRIHNANQQLQHQVSVRGDVSSQFLTALLMALPLAAGYGAQDFCIQVEGELISRPYVEITLQLMQSFGVEVRRKAWRQFIIPAGCHYRSPGSFRVEADASSASYFIAAAALAARQQALVIEGIDERAIQGDIRFVDAARLMGAHIQSQAGQLQVRQEQWPLKGIELDCNHIPDAAMTLAMMALYADGPSCLRNIASWRVKETDRLHAMACELRKLGAQIEEGEDFLRITPPTNAQWRAASLSTYDDHRMAMCASLAAFNPGKLPMRIQDPACVAKTYPDYFEDFFQIVQPWQTPPVICIDGPTASGKGTLASQLAQCLGYMHLDSGAIYRAAALAVLRQGLSAPPLQERAIADLIQLLDIRFAEDRVLMNTEDVSAAIRSEEVGLAASAISALPAVRQALLEQQRQAARLPGLIADGRDMGTVVFPQAQMKIFLVADVAKRAKRRFEQLQAQGIEVKMADLCANLKQRDAQDQAREVSALKPAQDALLLDNSGLSIEQSVAQALDWWQQRQPFDS